MRILILFLSLMFVLLSAPSTFGCVCASTTVKESFRSASAVFTGKFLRSEYRKGIKNSLVENEFELTGKRKDYEVLVDVFESDVWWKGSPTQEVVLMSDQARMSDGSAIISDCGLGFRPGTKYLVYAYGEGDEFGTGFYTLTKRVAKAAKEIYALNKLARPVVAR